jgi:hypothetical protein
VMSLHLILSRSCLDYYKIAGFWHSKIWCLTCKIHYNNRKVRTARLVKLSQDPYTEMPIPSMSNTQHGNCLFPSFNGSIAHLWPAKTDFHLNHTCLRPQYSRRSFVEKLKPGGTTAFSQNLVCRRHRTKCKHKATTFGNTMRNCMLSCKHSQLPMTA